ncbi:hypothetical protein K7185_08055 [Clostridium butyricum]|nr:hypothetical protein [Clostridium butyricum]MBZ0312424.1 hypothetical protein [Clostridium butyricum]
MFCATGLVVKSEFCESWWQDLSYSTIALPMSLTPFPATLFRKTSP